MRYSANALIGGAPGALDANHHTLLTAGEDTAVAVIPGDKTYFYEVIATTDPESVPTLIRPDSGGDLGWQLVEVYGASGAAPALSLITAVGDFFVGSGVGAVVKKTLAEVKTLLGLGSAAYTDSTAYDAAGAASGAVNSHLSAYTHNNIHAAGSDAETAASLGTLIAAAAEKTTPVAADKVPLVDSVTGDLQWVSPDALGGGSGSIGGDVVFLPEASLEQEVSSFSGMSATVATGTFPHSICYGFGSLWVTAATQCAVERINPETFAVTSISIGANPANQILGICVGAGSVWVACNGGNTVIRIDPADNSFVRINVGTVPRDVIFDGTYIRVTNSSDNTVGKINPANNAYSTPITCGTMTYRLGFDGQHVWCGNFNSANVSKINPATDTVVATVAVGTSPWGVYYDGRYVCVSNYGVDTISIINPTTATVIATISAATLGGSGAGSLGLHDLIRVRNELWVTCSNTAVIKCIDINSLTLIRSIPTGLDPAVLARDKYHVWNTNALGNTISRHLI